MVLICTSLISDVQHPFMYQDDCMSSLGGKMFIQDLKFFAHLKIIFYCVVGIPYTSQILRWFYQIVCKYFLPLLLFGEADGRGTWEHDHWNGCFHSCTKILTLSTLPEAPNMVLSFLKWGSEENKGKFFSHIFLLKSAPAIMRQMARL